MLVQLARSTASPGNVALAIGSTFLVTGFVVLVASRGKHLSWPVFLLVGGIAFYAGI